MQQGTLYSAGKLTTRHVRVPSPPHVRVPSPPGPHAAKGLRLPFGRLFWTRDRGDSRLLSSQVLATNLSAIHYDGDGAIKDVRDLGSGLVTSVGVNLMSYDFTWAGGATLKQANYHAIGTGATAAASSDAWLQTAQGSTSLSGTTNGYMTGAQSVIANATGSPYSPVYQTVASFTFTGSVSVTEWILAINNSANVTGTATSTSSTSLTNTGAAFATGGNGLQLWTVETGVTTPVNTSPTTQPQLQVVTNTATSLTGLDNVWGAGTKSWLSLTNQAVSTPGGTSTYVVFPTAWDHKVFGVLSAISGDVIQFTYQLSINSGG
jgi:hypothetical protein